MSWIDLPGANPSRGELIFHILLSWAMLWVGLLMTGLAWSTLGARALLLVIVSLAAGIYCRPWRGTATWVLAICLLIFSSGLPAWLGGTWLLTAFLVCGWVEWCGHQLRERLLQDEELLTWALQSRGADPIVHSPIAIIEPGD